MKTLFFGLLFVSPPFLKKLLLRWFCGAKIGSGVHIGWFSAVMGRRIELGTYAVIRPFTLIKLTGEVKLDAYSEISSFNLVYGSASLIVGEGSYIGSQCLINADEEVRLGRGSALGPRSMVFTHGSFLPYTEGYWVKLAGVTIGNKVWCAAGVFIHPGVAIGDDTFINSRSVVTQSIPSGSVVEGNPAKVIHSMESLKRKMSPRRVDAALDQLLHDFAEIGLRRELGLEFVEETKHSLRFCWRGRPYLIRIIPSTGNTVLAGESKNGLHQIFITNYPGWTSPSGGLVFDLTTMRTPFRSDPVHTGLQLFMQRYYGIKFKEQERD